MVGGTGNSLARREARTRLAASASPFPAPQRTLDWNDHGSSWAHRRRSVRYPSLPSRAATTQDLRRATLRTSIDTRRSRRSMGNIEILASGDMPRSGSAASQRVRRPSRYFLSGPSSNRDGGHKKQRIDKKSATCHRSRSRCIELASDLRQYHPRGGPEADVTGGTPFGIHWESIDGFLRSARHVRGACRGGRRHERACTQPQAPNQSGTEPFRKG
jgi:hypothetical protein